MPVRYDSTSDTLRVSVTDLVRERRAASAALAGPQRAELGRNAHILHAERRASAEETYLPEQPVSLELTVDGGRVLLSGRIDGVWSERGQTILEEVKLKPLGSAELPLPGDLKQLLLYLWIWRTTHADEPAPAGRLTYLDPLNGTVDEHVVERSIHLLDELRVEVHRRLLQILRYERAEAARLAERRRHAGAVVWPWPERRPLQTEMEEAVAEALNGKRHLLLESPTGSGKTAPILLTAYRECVRHGWRLAYATSRTSQQADRLALIEAATGYDNFRGHIGDNVSPDHVSPDHVSPDVDDKKGDTLRTKCPPAEQDKSGHPGHLARGRVLLLGSQARLGAAPPNEREDDPIDRYDAPEWLSERLNDPDPITPDDVKSLAEQQGVDPGLVQSAFAREADVLIGDVNLFVRRGGRYGGWFDPGRFARPTVLLVDEAHGVVDRVRDQHAGRVRMKDIARIADEADFHNAPWGDEVLGVLDTLAERLDARLRDLDETGVAYERIDPDDPDFAQPLERLALLSPALFAAGVTGETRELLRHLLNAAAATREPHAFSAYIETKSAGVFWELMDSAHVLRPVWESTRSTILFSATLAPFDLTAHQLGLPPRDCERLSLVPPVDSSARTVIRYVGLSTTWRRREETLGELCELLVHAAQATDGAWLVFFPSRAYLEQARAALAYQPVSVTELQAGLTPAMLKFLDREAGPRLHLAVLGGKYAEGFDPPAGLYTGAAVVSMGIPPPNARDELLSLYEGQDEDSTVSPYLVQGVRRIRQAGGRLFRSPEQAGVLLLIDHRYQEPQVEALLGDDWAASDIVDDASLLHDFLTDWKRNHPSQPGADTDG
ncbi:PD-(D/E)XK nuclease family protein [bacterium]|nr:PD-(D/E)XK nuclease family protein [bacterium]